MDYRKSYLILLTLFTIFFGIGTEPLPAQQSTIPDNLSLGTIDFPSSVSGEAQKEFLTGVLALHSFWYPEARDHFQKAQKLDPSFALAYWGEAMTHDHPIWGQHDQSAGKTALEKMDRHHSLKWNEREKAYVDAVRILYDSDLSINKRRKQYAQAMRKLAKQYPADDEAAAFSALASMSVSGFDFNSEQDVMPVAEVLEDLYERNPEHPGAMHYLIHVYDSDAFAKKGLRPANDYAGVAYSSSHAIHMPSHIYKRMDMWDKVIESNIRAYQASIEWQQQTGRPLKDRDYHAYSWLFDAYLEINNYEKACEMIDEISEIEARARKNGEEVGRISSTLQSFRNQYEQVDVVSAPKCS